MENRGTSSSEVSWSSGTGTWRIEGPVVLRCPGVPTICCSGTT